MAIYQVKNTSAASITIQGSVLSSNVYFIIQEDEIDSWRKDAKFMNYVSDGTLIVNNGNEDITDPITAWNYIRGELTPPSDDLGRWKVVNDNPAKGKNKENFILSTSVFVDSLTKYQEFLKLKDNEKLYLEQIVVGSPELPYKFDFEYLKDFNGYFHKSLPTKLENVICMTVRQSAAASSKTIFVSCEQNYDFSYIITSGIYHVSNTDMKERLSANNIMSENGIESEYAVKIVSYDSSAKTILLEKPLDIDLKPGDKVVFAERSIIHLAAERTTTNVKTSYPFEITTSGTSYLKIEVENLSTSDAGEISFTIYGYKEIY